MGIFLKVKAGCRNLLLSPEELFLAMIIQKISQKSQISIISINFENILAFRLKVQIINKKNKFRSIILEKYFVYFLKYYSVQHSSPSLRPRTCSSEQRSLWRHWIPWQFRVFNCSLQLLYTVEPVIFYTCIHFTPVYLLHLHGWQINCTIKSPRTFYTLLIL